MTLKYKRYKFGKVKPAIEEKMIELRKQGFRLRFIAKKFGVSEGTVSYHTNKHYNLMVKEYAKRKVETTEGRLKEREYMKNYIKERYNTDSDFRKRQLEMVTNGFKEKREERKKKGLCASCGVKLKNKRFFACEKCRNKLRDKARKRKDK
jgi:hypothetical protein